ncbi:MAG: histidinol-phosphate transaminase [Herpetosiphon sp.]
MTVVHGGIDPWELRALGLQPHEILDFSSNINPFGPPAGVRLALASYDPSPYPDRNCSELRALLAAHHGVAVEQLLIGNGCAELIHIVARALLDPDDKVLVVEPAFGEYAAAARLARATVLSWRAEQSDGFKVHLTDLQASIHRHRPRLLWLCTPGNPTGYGMPPAELAILAATCRAANTLLVIDRAYHGFEACPADHASIAALVPHTIQLFSLTKLYALAGLRLGYLLADTDLVGSIARFQPPWSVNGLAQVAGRAALSDTAFPLTTLPQLWAAGTTLQRALEGLGISVHRGDLPFLMAECRSAAAMRTALLQAGCLVRDCTSFGLPHLVRIAPRRPADNERLVDAWRTACLPPS